MHFLRPFAAARSLQLLSALLVGLLASASASATNISDVDVTLELTFKGAVFTSDMSAAQGGGNDYDDLDFNYGSLPGTFELGTGAQSSSTTELLINGTAWDIFPSPIVEDDVLSIVISTDAEATGAGSQFTASLLETIELFSFLYVEDSLTFLFDYELTWALDLEEPDLGQAVGIVEADVDGGPFYFDVATTPPTGGTLLLGDVESGSFAIEHDNTLGDNEQFEVGFNTRVVSNARVDAPEPGSLALLSCAALFLARLRRRAC